MISNDNQVSFHFAVDDNDYYKVRVEFMENQEFTTLPSGSQTLLLLLLFIP